MTKISVLLPIYNTDPTHLRDAINSILSQTFSDFELLICNDASTNARAEQVVMSYDDARIRYSKNEQNFGIAKTRNKMMDIAVGEYLAVMDHDDLCLPDRFEKQIAFMDTHPNVAVCGTAHKRFGKMFKNNIIRYPLNNDEIKAELFFKNVIHHPSAMIRKETLIKHSIRYDETLVSANDRKLYMDVSSYADLHNLPDVECLYRLHTGMTSRTKRQAIVEEQKKIRGDFLKKMGAQLTAEQTDILNNYVMNGRCRITDRQTLNAIESLLTTLVSANAQSSYLPSKQFNKICAKYFVKRCYNAAIYGRISSKYLLKKTSLPVQDVKKPVLLKLANFCIGDKK